MTQKHAELAQNFARSQELECRAAVAAGAPADAFGFSSAREGRGLAGMRRRTQTLGGRAKLEIAPSPIGTTLSMSLPRAS